MTAFTIGDRVRIRSPFHLGATGTVTDIDNGLTWLTVTVLLDLTGWQGEYETYFAPDELEIITDDDANSIRAEPVSHDSEWQGIPGSEVAAGVAAE
jgi:hypothetical protein